MTIPENRYVDVTYRVGGATAITNRSLSGMLITQSTLVPPDTLIVMTNAHDVGAAFGFQSREYGIAQDYFGYIGKNGGRTEKLSFCRWNSENTFAEIVGGTPEKNISVWKNLKIAGLTLTINGYTQSLNDLNFENITSLFDVAALITDAFTKVPPTYNPDEPISEPEDYAPSIAAADLPNPFYNAKMEYRDNQQVFILTLAEMTEGKIEIEKTTLSTFLGFDNALSIPAAIAKDIITQLNQIFDNLPIDFGSFAFVNPQTDDTYILTARFLNAKNPIKYGFFVELMADKGAELANKLLQYNGVGATLGSGQDGDYAYLLPMFIASATDYTQNNGVLNFMFTISKYPPTVTNSSDADKWDELRVNYVGQTQQAGRNVSFYQTGVLFGNNNFPADMNVFFNELWLQDAMTVALLNLLLILPNVPANESGLGAVRATMQGVIDQAIYNGVISQKAILSTLQKSVIQMLVGSSNAEAAMQAVQSIGYYVTLQIQDFTTESTGQAVDASLRTRKKIVYKMIYKKDDGISKIEGEDILI